MMTFVEEAEKIKKNIVGGNALGQVTNIDMDIDEAHKTNSEFWNTIGSEL